MLNAEPRRSRLRIAWLAVGMLTWVVTFVATTAAAFASTPVAVQLVLSVDVSGSVSQDRFELQRQGYAAAFRDAQVLQAIQSTSTGSIAVAMVQWTGPSLHIVAVDWTLISDAASAEHFAAAIEAAPRCCRRSARLRPARSRWRWCSGPVRRCTSSRWTGP